MTDRAASFPFASSMRLKNSWEFDAVFRTGRQLKGELVRIYYLYRDSDTKVGAAAGKRIGSAAKRVRGRRMIRETLRRIMPWIKEGVWLVISLRECALESDAVSIYYETAGLLERAKLLSDYWNGADWRVDDPRTYREK